MSPLGAASGPRRRIAVIGAGIAGLATAWCLQRRHDVTLFEAETRLGGHVRTLSVGPDDDRRDIDTGFIVCNERNYPNLLALFRALEVPLQPTAMSFSVSLGDGAWEWHGSERAWSVFAQPSNLLSPRHWSLLRDILRLNAHCRDRLARGALPSGSLADFLAACGYSSWLAERYLLPMAGMIWSCSPAQAARYPAADFMRFFDSHGLFTATHQPQWFSVIGGSRRYVDALQRQLRANVHCGRPVRHIRREATGLRLSLDDGEAGFDAVVSAVHSDRALAMLADPSDCERTMLSGIPYARNRVVLHNDASLMPRRRAAWASWNYRHATGALHDDPVCGTYWMNHLQRLQDARPWLVTLNPDREPAAGTIHDETTLDHPVYGANSRRTHTLLPLTQGRGGLYWAGAWCGYGFHEDGLNSALRAVAQIDPACLPDWATIQVPVHCPPPPFASAARAA